MQHVLLPMPTKPTLKKPLMPMRMFHHPHPKTGHIYSCQTPVSLKPGMYQTGLPYLTPRNQTAKLVREEMVKSLSSLPSELFPINAQVRFSKEMPRPCVYLIANYHDFNTMAQARMMLHKAMQYRTNELWQVAKDLSLIHFAIWVWHGDIYNHGNH